MNLDKAIEHLESRGYFFEFANNEDKIKVSWSSKDTNKVFEEDFMMQDSIINLAEEYCYCRHEKIERSGPWYFCDFCGEPVNPVSKSYRKRKMKPGTGDRERSELGGGE